MTETEKDKLLVELLENSRKMEARIRELEEKEKREAEESDGVSPEKHAYLAWLARETRRGNMWVLKAHNRHAGKYLDKGQNWPVPRFPFDPPEGVRVH